MLQTWHNLPLQWQKRLTVRLEREWYQWIWSSVAAELCEHSLPGLRNETERCMSSNHVPSGMLTRWGCMQVRVISYSKFKRRWTWQFEAFFIAEFELGPHLFFSILFCFVLFFADRLVGVSLSEPHTSGTALQDACVCPVCPYTKTLNRGFARDVTNCILPEVSHLGGHARKKRSLLAVLLAAVTMVDGTEEFLSTIYRQF